MCYMYQQIYRTWLTLLSESISEIIAKFHCELNTAIPEFKLKPLWKVCKLIKKVLFLALQSSRSRSKLMLLLERSCHKERTWVKYESPISSDLKVMAIVKVFQKKIKLQGQGHKVQNMVPC